jgi:hypothetical protein
MSLRAILSAALFTRFVPPLGFAAKRPHRNISEPPKGGFSGIKPRYE